ncbi:MAG: hypothetical protein K2N06_02225 [Oscillospiraceae bacterium]|nr:hypothetical protein [Oscillospiraceae bacterium]
MPIFVCVCFAIGVPFLIVSIMSLKYREGKPFQAKVHLSGDGMITVRYKSKGKVYYKDFEWKPINPLVRKPRVGQNVTLEGPLENPTRMIYSNGGLESSFALKIVGIVIGGFFTLVGLFFLLLMLLPLIDGFISRNNVPDDFYSSYYGISAMIHK